ncbi:MAG: helix-turn-helix domain-containing protein [Clostridiales bacterium]|jgi:ribosome-binding protein aMBF1 (putative translation factor)|nr:helix-turn-helix domain-containing protein [Clostridiales bacterium]
MSKIINGKEFKTVDDILAKHNVLTQAELDEIDLKIELKGALIEAREKKGISQEKLAEMSGLKQSAIARLETSATSPRLDTLIKVAKPLGYKLVLVPDKPSH